MGPGAWIVVVAVAVGLAVVGLWRRLPGGGQSADLDHLGSVSEGWLSDERGRKDS